MQQILILMSIMLTFNFINMIHPLSMGLILLMQTIIISLLCGLMTYTYWFSYILFLIMVGGMLILFIYMTSLASNELFIFKMNNLLYNLIIFFIFLISILLYDNFFSMMINLENMQFMNMMMEENSSNLIKLYNNPSMNMTLMLINYLLLTLIIVIKITNINYGPLRQMF
uniref:NADH-ubiquinone oxidoreductase chain 6 n=1 Tax=Neuronema laminatum TaxID=1701416 RepID=A0A0U2GKM7_NEULA|nr:NADH dehydrogenase subunit 6 [Neuronema laminatum]AKZ17623.1 NADH dehydrogenase subunit 6 [Neuronema laminatum]